MHGWIPVWLLTSSSNQRSEPRDDDGRATGTNNNNNTNNMTRSHQLHCHYPDVHFLPPRLQSAGLVLLLLLMHGWIPVWLLTSSSNQRSEPRDDDGRGP
jgi:hypothetical protein